MGTRLTRSLSRVLLPYAAAMAVPALVAHIVYATQCVADTKPAQGDCNDSTAECAGPTDRDICTDGARWGEVLQLGAFSTAYEKGKSTSQTGTAALCKIKYFCKFDEATSTCSTDQSREYPLGLNTGRVNKPTVVYCP